MTGQQLFTEESKPKNQLIIGNFQLPSTFETVLKKMNNEIDTISIKEATEVPSMGHFTSISEVINPKIIISLIIRFKQDTDKLKGNCGKYSEIINTLFNATYPEVNFIHFRIDSLEMLPKKTNREVFYELFGKKG